MEYKIIKSLKKGYNGEKYYVYELVDGNGDVLSTICVEKENIVDKVRYIKNFAHKKVAYLYNFETNNNNRNKGCGRCLLNEIIRRFKGKYDLIHLNACPYHETLYGVVYREPKNGLNKQQLIKYYKSFGFKLHGTTSEGWKIMLLKAKSGLN